MNKLLWMLYKGLIRRWILWEMSTYLACLIRPLTSTGLIHVWKAVWIRLIQHNFSDICSWLARIYDVTCECAAGHSVTSKSFIIGVGQNRHGTLRQFALNVLSVSDLSLKESQPPTMILDHEFARDPNTVAASNKLCLPPPFGRPNMAPPLLADESNQA